MTKLIGYYIIDILKLFFLFWGILSFEKHQKTKNIIGVYLLGGLGVILSKHLIAIDIHEFIVSAIVVASTMYNTKGMKRKFIVIPVYVAICIVDLLFAGLVTLVLHYSTSEVLQNKVLTFGINSISLVLIIFITLYFNYKNIIVHRYLKINNMIRNILMISLGLIGMALYVVPIQMNGINTQDSDRGMVEVVGITISGFVFLGILLVLFYFNIKHNYYKECLELNRKMQFMQKEHYKALILKEEKTKMLLHDVMNHLYCMEKFAEKKEFDKLTIYLGNMRSNVKEMNQGIDTGNNTLDIIVGDIVSTFNNRVSIICNGLFPEKVSMTDMDLCTLFSNLLKNAVEAELNVRQSSLQCEDNNCSIIVDAKYIDKAVFMTISNRFSGNVKIHNGILITTKNNIKTHGFGSINVREIVKKYKGDIEYKQENNRFIVELVFQNMIQL